MENEKPAKKPWVKPEVVLISSASIEKGIFRSQEGTVVVRGQSLVAKNGAGQGYIGFPRRSFAS